VGERWKTEYPRSGWCGRRRKSQPPSQRPRWVGPASSWRRSWRETTRPTHWSRAPTRAGLEASGEEEAPAGAREEPRAQPAAERQRKPVERWGGEGPRCRCFGSDRTPGVAPQGVFRSRTVSTTVAKWFVPVARGTVDKVYRFGPLRDA
jgi:hypothetical protein